MEKTKEEIKTQNDFRHIEFEKEFKTIEQSFNGSLEDVGGNLDKNSDTIEWDVFRWMKAEYKKLWLEDWQVRTERHEYKYALTECMSDLESAKEQSSLHLQRIKELEEQIKWKDRHTEALNDTINKMTLLS